MPQAQRRLLESLGFGQPEGDGAAGAGGGGDFTD
jgi:hypothetical protein